MKKRQIVSIVTGAILTVCLCSMVVVFTQPGAQSVLSLTKLVIGDRIQFSKVTGSFFQSLSFKDVQINSKRHTTSISSALVSVDWLSLLKGNLKVRTIQVNGVVIKLHDVRREAGEPSARVPIRIDLEHFLLSDAVIVRGEAKTKVDQLLLVGELREQYLNISKLQLSIDDWSIGGGVRVTLENTIDINGNLDARYFVDEQAAINASIIAKGDLSKTIFNISATGEWVGNANAELTWPIGGLPQLKATANVPKFKWPISTAPTLAVENGNIQLQTASDKVSLIVQGDGALKGRKFSQFDASFNGNWNVKPKIQVKGELSARYKVEDDIDVTHNGELVLRKGVLMFDQQISSPLQALAKGKVTYLNGITNLTIEAHSENYELTANDIKTSFSSIELSLDGKVGDIALAASAEVSGDKLTSTVKLSSIGKITKDKIQFEKLSLDNFSGSITSSGSVLFRDQVEVDFAIDFTQISLVDINKHLPDEVSGTASVVGPLGAIEAYVTASEVRLAGRDLSNLSAQILVGKKGLYIKEASAKFCNGHVMLAGDVFVNPALDYDLNAQIINCDLSLFSPKVKARADMWLTINGSRTAYDIEFSRVLSTLYGVPLIAGGKILGVPGEAPQIKADIRSSQSQLRISGKFDDEIDMEASLLSGDLSEFFRNLTGAAQATAKLTGNAFAPNANIVATMSNFGHKNLYASRGDVYLDFNFEGQRDLSATVKFRDVKVGKNALSEVNFAIDGSLSDHVVTITSQGDIATNQSWTGQLSILNDEIDSWQLIGNGVGYISQKTVGEWKWSGAPEVVFNGEQASINQLCLMRDETSLCTNAQIDYGANWLANVDGTGLEVALLQDYVDAPVKASGQFSASLSARGSDGDYEANVTGNILPGTFYVDLETQQEHIFDYETGSLSGNITHNKSDIKFNFDTGSGDYIDLALLIGASPFNKQTFKSAPIDGVLTATANNLKWWPLVTSQVKPESGLLSINLQISGTVERPSVLGGASLKLSQIEIPGNNVTWDEGTITLTGDGEKINVKALIVDKSNEVRLDGEFATGSTPAFNAKVTGAKMPLLNFRDKKLDVSPDLTLNWRPEGLAIDGKVGIPRAYYHLVTLPTIAVSTSDDEIIINQEVVDEQDKNRKTPFKSVISNITYVLGNDVRFKGYGLEAKLNGAITIVDKPDSPRQANGQLAVETGEFTAFSKRFPIEQGRLTFVGPIDNPGVSMLSTRQVENYTVGVRASGSLQNRALSVFSEPPTTEQEALSLLLLGRKLEEATADNNANSNADALARAALALSLNRSSNVTRDIGEQVGINNLEVTTETSDDGNAELVVGGYLGSRLYLSYGREVFTNEDHVPENRVRVRYNISDRLSLEATDRGSDTGVDLIYSFERD